MNRTFSWKPAAILTLAGAQIISAQTSWTQFKGAHYKGVRPEQSLTPTPSTPAPGIIPIGSALTFGGTNAPDTYSAITTFNSTPVVVDNGAVKISQQQVATGPGGEWDIFHMQTTGGGPVAGNINAYWNITMNYILSQPVDFDAVVNQWTVNGTPVTPLTNGIGTICCAASSNPILPGEAYYNSGFSVPYPAGPFTGWQQIFVSPYSLVSSGGIDPSTANGFTFALHFTLAAFTVKSATAGQIEPFAAQSIVAAYGSNLAATTAAATPPLGTSLGGVTVTVTDSGGTARLAPLFYVSPTQINFEIPDGTVLGGAAVTVQQQNGPSQASGIEIGNVSPGLFELNTAGLVAAYILPVISGVQQPLTLPFSPINVNAANEQFYLEMYGTGIRNTQNVTVTVGNVSVPVLFSGPAPLYAGLDQVNIGPLPSSLAGQGSVNIVLTADGQAANTVTVPIQ